MTDQINDDHPLASELANARERITALEQQVKEQQAHSATPEQREEAAKQTEGQAVLDAVQRGKDKNVTRTRIN